MADSPLLPLHDPASETAEPDRKRVVLGVVRSLSGQTTVKDGDHLIHERMRLGIVSALAVNPSLTFTELKRLLDTTDGNLSVHARKLEEAGFVTCHKSFADRKPRTDYVLTPEGRSALDRYLTHMESLIEAMRGR